MSPGRRSISGSGRNLRDRRRDPLDRAPPGTGHEQSGRRPAVIVQDESYAGTLPVVLVVPLTTATATLRFPGTLLIRPDPGNGLRQASVALVFQMRAVDRRRIGDRVGNVSADVLAGIFAALDQLLGL